MVLGWLITCEGLIPPSSDSVEIFPDSPGGHHYLENKVKTRCVCVDIVYRMIYCDLKNVYSGKIRVHQFGTIRVTRAAMMSFYSEVFYLFVFFQTSRLIFFFFYVERKNSDNQSRDEPDVPKKKKFRSQSLGVAESSKKLKCEWVCGVYGVCTIYIISCEIVTAVTSQ